MNIDFKGHRIIIGNEILHLTETESDILELLYKNKNRVVKYDEIITKIYKTESDKGLQDATKKHISSLKRKIGEYIKIRNITKVGYIIEEGIE